MVLQSVVDISNENIFVCDSASAILFPIKNAYYNGAFRICQLLPGIANLAK